MSPRDRYWRWAGFAGQDEALNMLHPDLRINNGLNEYVTRKNNILQALPESETHGAGINRILLTDIHLVLPNDMLTKVDLMSMANSLEVRTPFLDYEVVNFAFSLPSSYKINRSIRKRVVQDFREMLPRQLYNRPKKGFEVPLLKWLKHEMKSIITDDLLAEKFIREQGVFHYPEIIKLKQQLFSANPGDAHARIWGLIVFQWWWKKYIR
jgi:asparagine synthase (glutamine-hydrolysing)